MEQHPETITHLDELMSYAAFSRSLSAVKMVYDLVIKHGAMASVLDQKGCVVNKLQEAMATAAGEDDLEMVEFFFEKFPGVNWYAAIREAARRGRARVFRFFLVNGYARCAMEDEFKNESKWNIRLLCFLFGKTAI